MRSKQCRLNSAPVNGNETNYEIDAAGVRVCTNPRGISEGAVVQVGRRRRRRRRRSFKTKLPARRPRALQPIRGRAEEEEEEEEELFKTKLPARRPRVQPIRGRAEDEEDVMVVSWTC